jgi:hypothetical protein
MALIILIKNFKKMASNVPNFIAEAKINQIGSGNN